METAVPSRRSSPKPGLDRRRLLAVEATESASTRRSSAAVLHPVDTSLLVRVAVPVTGWDCLLKFRIKPGEKLEQVQQGVSQSLEALVEKLRVHLEDSDLESNDRRYDVAKEECQARLAQWQNQLTEAKAATIRAESAKVEMTKLKESYLKEILQLRQQLSLKQLAESKGEEFVPDNVSHLPQEQEQTVIESADTTADEVKVLEMQYEKELDKLRRKNTELQYKLKTKQIQSDLQTDLLAKRMELKEFEEVGVQAQPMSREVATETEPFDPPQEPPANESRCARTPARRKTQGVGGPPTDVRSPSKPLRQPHRKPSLRYDCGTTRDAGCGDEDDFVAASGSRISFSRQASADSAAPTREVSFVLPGSVQGVSVGVQASFDPPVPADSPPMVRRPHRHLVSEKDEEEEAFRRPRPRVATAEGRLREKAVAPHNMRAVTLPEAEDEVAPMMSISSGDHCAALFSTRPSEAARPAKRTIARPHLPNPSSSRPSSRGSCRERIDTQLMTTC